MMIEYIGIFFIGCLLGALLRGNGKTSEEEELNIIKFKETYNVYDKYSIKIRYDGCDQLVTGKIEKLDYPELIMSFSINHISKDGNFETTEIINMDYNNLLNKVS